MDKEKKLTFEDIKKAVEKIKPLRKRLIRIEICKKHWKDLNKYCEIREVSSPMWGILSGIEVVIKPYLKKVRMYYEPKKPKE